MKITDNDLLQTLRRKTASRLRQDTGLIWHDCNSLQAQRLLLSTLLGLMAERQIPLTPEAPSALQYVVRTGVTAVDNVWIWVVAGQYVSFSIHDDVTVTGWDMYLGGSGDRFVVLRCAQPTSGPIKTTWDLLIEDGNRNRAYYWTGATPTSYAECLPILKEARECYPVIA